MGFRKIIIFFLIFFMASCSRHNSPLSGYIEGEYTYISSSIPGTLFALYVKRGQMIAKNHLLFALDPEPESSQLASAKTLVAQNEAQFNFAKSQYERQLKLFKTKFASEETLQQTQTEYATSQQQLLSSRELLNKNIWSLKQKTAYAPVSGFVFDTFFRIGENVSVEQPVVALLNAANIKVLFYVPEELLSHLKIGKNIYFTCDGCKAENKATISYISPEASYTPPIIYSKDTRAKLVYLIKADLPPDTAYNFHPGQPIDVLRYER